MFKKYCIGIGTILMMLIVVYQMSWIISMKNKDDFAEKSASESSTLNEMDLQLVNTDINQNQIYQDTTIIVESYDTNGMLISREIDTPNDELVGMSRLDLMVYANEYKMNAKESERMQGLERMVVQAFSSDSVTLVKYYGDPIDEPGYWIEVRDNIIIVYTEDRSEIYEFTNIELWQLPQEVQYDLVDGIHVNNERELFDFLQTYSS